MEGFNPNVDSRLRVTSFNPAHDPNKVRLLERSSAGIPFINVKFSLSYPRFLNRPALKLNAAALANGSRLADKTPATLGDPPSRVSLSLSVMVGKS